MSKKSIAITGVNGFPGQAVLRWLDYVLGSDAADDAESLALREKYHGVVAIDITPPQREVYRHEVLPCGSNGYIRRSKIGRNLCA